MLMAYLLIRFPVSRALAGTASNVTVALSGYRPAAAVTTVQALIMMLVLRFALGLHGLPLREVIRPYGNR